MKNLTVYLCSNLRWSRPGEDAENFMCRETDMVALENLLLHLLRLASWLLHYRAVSIFAGGHVNDLRKFVNCDV